MTSSDPHAPADLGIDEDLADWDFPGDHHSEEVDDPIISPVVTDPRPRWLIYALGQLLWTGVIWGLLALNGQLVPYLVLFAALGSGMSLFTLERSRWRSVGWLVWLVAVVGVCRWLTLGGNDNPPWWIGPGLIIMIVLCAYGLWRWGQMRLKRERRQPPLVID